jgi:hypothetical protein
MPKSDYYILDNFIKEMNNLCYDVNNVNLSNVWKFRYVCYKFNYFMREVPLPNIKQNNYYEAVFIEFRELPNIEFIIRNAIFKLGINWSFTVICGNDNYKYIDNIVNNINKDIKIIKLDYNNLNASDYSRLLMSEQFWNLLVGEKILIYQEDSLIFHDNITPFIKYDYVGAPFLKTTNDTPNCVGNGGLSLRTKCKMIEVIKRCDIKDMIINSSTKDYMWLFNLNCIPEDVYFSKNMQEFFIGEVADWKTAFEFSSEQVFNSNSFGGHKFWISNETWEEFLKDLFNYKKYVPKSGLKQYLKFKKIYFNTNNKKDNAFDIDLEFFCLTNNITYVNNKIALEYINKIGLDGFIYHPKQLLNIFGNIEFYRFMKNIYAFYDSKFYTIQYFTNTYIYNTTFDYMADLLIEKKFDTINDNYDTLLLVFIGNEELGINLIKKIIDYKKINKEFSISFCFNKKIENKSNIKKLIRENFDFYAVYYSCEFGTDITPTLLMYNDINKKHNVKHILKFHTKSISHLYNTLTNYLLSKPITQIVRDKKRYCNCIGPPECYISIVHDKYNNELKDREKIYINNNYFFVAGTIFYAENNVFDKVLDFIKNNNYRAYLLNNLYENNSINQDFSPIHFLERLFGSIKL